MTKHDRVRHLLADLSYTNVAIAKIADVDEKTIRRWRAEDEHFDAECARACEIHAEADYDKMQRIERQVLRGEIDGKAANTVLSNMRWRMEKRNKARFGQRVEVTHNVTDTLADQMKAARERAASSD